MVERALIESWVAKHVQKPGEDITHMYFGGPRPFKLHVAPEDIADFHRLYVNLINSGEEAGANSFVEKVQRNGTFRLFVDIDIQSSDNVQDPVDFSRWAAMMLDETVAACYKDPVLVESRRLAVRIPGKVHVVYPDIVANKQSAHELRSEFIHRAKESESIYSGLDWSKTYDASVYNGSGLRMLHSHKGSMGKKGGKALEVLEHGTNYSDVYRPFDLASFTPSTEELTVTILADFSINCASDLDVTKMAVHESRKETSKEKSKSKSAIEPAFVKPLGTVGTPSDDLCVDASIGAEELAAICSYLGIALEYLRDIVPVYSKIRKVGKHGDLEVTLVPQPCPILGLHPRTEDPGHTTHLRVSEGRSSTYVIIKPSGAFLKCWDEQCKETIRLPDPGSHLEAHFGTADKFYYLRRCLDRTHESMARFAFEEFKHRMRVVRKGNGGTFRWYAFHDHRWHEEEIILGSIMSDDGLSKRFDEYVEHLRREWTGDEGDDSELEETIADVESFKRKCLRMRGFVGNIVPLVADKLEKLDPKFDSKLNAMPHLLCFQNGVMDFKTASFRDGRPSDYCSFSTGVDYVPWSLIPDKTKEDLDVYLCQLFPDPELRTYGVWVFASSMDASIKTQHFHILHGGGSNGKSTLISLVSLAMGDYAVEGSTSMFTQKRGSSGAASPDLVHLKGRRLTTLSETDSDETLRLGLLKQLSGNDKVMARGLYEAPQEFYMLSKFLLSANEIPKIEANPADYGTWRRIKVLSFVSRFVVNPTRPDEFKLDPGFNDRLVDWAPAFASLLVHVVTQSKLPGGEVREPLSVTQRVRELRERNDLVGRWISGRVLVNSDNASNFGVQKLWRDYCDFCRVSLKVSDRERGDIDRFRGTLVVALGNPDLVKGIEVWKVELKGDEASNC